MFQDDRFQCDIEIRYEYLLSASKLLIDLQILMFHRLIYREKQMNNLHSNYSNECHITKNKYTFCVVLLKETTTKYTFPCINGVRKRLKKI